MKRSEGRILTTHAGSLPRPPELVNLFARRVREEPVNLEEMERQILAAKRRVIPRQIAAGIDIPSDGEQSRETFFLYVRRRMSGFSGGVTRPPPSFPSGHCTSGIGWPGCRSCWIRRAKAG